MRHMLPFLTLGLLGRSCPGPAWGQQSRPCVLPLPSSNEQGWLQGSGVSARDACHT